MYDIRTYLNALLDADVPAPPGPEVGGADDTTRESAEDGWTMIGDSRRDGNGDIDDDGDDDAEAVCRRLRDQKLMRSSAEARREALETIAASTPTTPPPSPSPPTLSSIFRTPLDTTILACIAEKTPLYVMCAVPRNRAVNRNNEVAWLKFHDDDDDDDEASPSDAQWAQFFGATRSAEQASRDHARC